MAIQNLRVSVADCQQENFYLSQVKIRYGKEKSPLALAKTQGRRLHYFQPANQILHFSRGYIFQRTRTSVQSGSSSCVGLSIFNVPRDNILNVLCKYLLFRPNSYAVPLPCKTKSNLLYSGENNRMYLVRHGSDSATARRMNSALLCQSRVVVIILSRTKLLNYC